MGIPLKRRLLFAWIALCAVLLQALAPAIAHAAARARGETLIEICSAEGMRSISIDADGKVVKDSAKKVAQCQQCLQQGAAAPPPAMPDAILPGAHAVFPPLFYQSRRPLFNWTAAQPRAPPSQS